MRFFKSIRAWWRGLFRKRRFNMLNATDNSEEWHMHLSPASIFAAFLSFVLLLFILVLSLVAYSPILEFLPGYRTEADRSRESLVQNIIRLDSMERMMNDMMTYNRNIALTREMLITNVWGYDFYGDDRTLDTHIKLLRRSLGPYSKFIVTLRGVGYRFETHGA